MNILTKPFQLKEKFTLQKKIQVKSLSIYPILYKNCYLVFQTPICFLPFGIQYDKIDIALEDTDLKNFIENIYNQLKVKTYKINSSIKPKEGIFPARLRLSLDNDIKIFNKNKQEVSKETIKPKCRCKLLVHFVFVWKNKTDKTCGIKLNILQIKICAHPLPTEYGFIDSDEEEEQPESKDPKNNPLYSKYFTMLNRGVPFFAVRQKMILDNLDPNIIGEVEEPDKNYQRKPKKKSPTVNSIGLKVPTPDELKKAIINIKINSQKKKNNS